MSNLFGSLFGDKPKEVTQPTSFETLPEEVQQGFLSLLQQGQQLPSDIFGPVGLGEGQLAALSQLQQPFGFTSGEEQGISALLNLPGIPNFGFGRQAQEQFGRASDILGRAPGLVDLAGRTIERGISPITGEEIETGISQFLNPFTQEVVGGATRDIREAGAALRPGIGSAATGAGAFGGSRQALVERGLNEDILRRSGDVAGQLRTQGFESAAGRALNKLTGERGRFLQGAGQQLSGAQTLGDIGSRLGGLGSQLFRARQGARDLRLGKAQAALQAGALQRGLPQQQALQALQLGEIPRDFALQQQQAPLQQLQFLQSILSSFGGGGGGTSFLQQPGLLERIGGGAEGLSSLGALFGLSDEILKENIKFIRKQNEFNIYEFNFKGESKKYEGVIAQEIEKIRPDAVTHVFGNKAVYYDKIGLEMKEVE